MVGVIGLVGEQPLGWGQGFEQVLGDTDVGDIARRQGEGDRSAEIVGQRVYLARAAAPRATDRLDRVPLFFDPRAERWTFTWVESMASSSGMPPLAASCSKSLRQTPWMLQRLKRLKIVVRGP